MDSTLRFAADGTVTIHRSYTVTGLSGDTLTVALTYSDSDGCDPRTVTLTYTRGLHVVTDADRAQKALDTPWKTSKEAAAEQQPSKVK